MIRLPDIPNVIPANPSPGAPSSAAMQARSRGIEDISRGLATVGTSLTSEALRIQQIENARRESEIRQGWQQSLAELNTRLATETDPTRIPQLTEDLIANLAPSLEDDSLPPALRDRLSEQFLNFSTGATIRAGEQASRLAITRARAAFENETTHAIKNHDRPGLEAAIATATDGFGLLPEHGEKIRDDFERAVELDLIDLAATELPDQILEYDTDDFQRVYPHLDRQDLRRAQANARREIQAQRSDEIDALEAALHTGRLREADVEAAQRLSPKDRQAFLKSLRATQPLDLSRHPEAWESLFALREAYTNPTVTDEAYAAQWNDARINVLSMLPESHQGDLKQELSYRSPANRRTGTESGSPATGSGVREYNTIARQRLGRALRDEIITPGQYEDIQAEMSRWTRTNPAASWEDLRNWVDTRLGVSTEDSPAFMMPPAPPVAPGMNPADIQRALDSMDAHPINPLLPTIDD